MKSCATTLLFRFVWKSIIFSAAPARQPLFTSGTIRIGRQDQPAWRVNTQYILISLFGSRSNVSMYIQETLIKTRHVFSVRALANRRRQ